VKLAKVPKPSRLAQRRALQCPNCACNPRAIVFALRAATNVGKVPIMEFAAKIAKFMIVAWLSVFAIGGFLAYATGSGIFDPERTIAESVETETGAETATQSHEPTEQRERVTRCPGDAGSFLYKMLTPIGDDCETPVTADRQDPRPDAALEAADPETARAVLRYRCRQIILRVLNDPGSAEWDDARNWRFTDDGDGVYTIYPTLRAKNALGAIVRTGFRCQVQEVAPEEWELLALEEI